MDGATLSAAIDRRDVPAICDALLPAFWTGVQMETLEAAVQTLKVRWTATISTRERQLIKISDLEKKLESSEMKLENANTAVSKLRAEESSSEMKLENASAAISKLRAENGELRLELSTRSDNPSRQ